MNKKGNKIRNALLQYIEKMKEPVYLKALAKEINASVYSVHVNLLRIMLERPGGVFYKKLGTVWVLWRKEK